MAGTTPIYGLPYPQSSDLVSAYPALGQDLAEDLDGILAAKANAASVGLEFVTSAAFTSASAVSVNSCFTSSYRNYRVLINYDGSAAADISLRLRASGSDNTANNYAFVSRRYIYTDGTAATQTYSGSYSSFIFGYPNAANAVQVAFDLFGPQATERTGLAFQVIAQDRGFSGQAQIAVTNSYDGFTFFPGTGTITGSLRVFGYRNS